MTTVNKTKQFLWQHGIIIKSGPRDNWTDCEADKILVHVPTGATERFRGTWWDDKYAKSMEVWAGQFPEIKPEDIAAEQTRQAYEGVP